MVCKLIAAKGTIFNKTYFRGGDHFVTIYCVDIGVGSVEIGDFSYLAGKSYNSDATALAQCPDNVDKCD